MVRGSDVIVNIVNYVVKKRNLRELFPLFSKSKFSDSSTNLMSTTDAIFSKQSSKAVNYVLTSLQLTNQASFLKKPRRAKIRLKKIIMGRGPCMGDVFSHLIVSWSKSNI